LAGIEELIYRGALLVQLSRLLPLAIALLLSSALFALAHSGRAVAPDTLSVAVYLLDGLAFGLAFWLTRSLWPPTLWHFSKNLSIWLLYSRSTLQFSPGLLQARLITPSIWTGAEGQAGLLDLFVTSAVLAALLLIARLHGVRRGA
jgi:membrane protease YdiL (CAAX protease family)